MVIRFVEENVPYVFRSACHSSDFTVDKSDFIHYIQSLIEEDNAFVERLGHIRKTYAKADFLIKTRTKRSERLSSLIEKVKGSPHIQFDDDNGVVATHFVFSCIQRGHSLHVKCSCCATNYAGELILSDEKVQLADASTIYLTLRCPAGHLLLAQEGIMFENI